MKTMRLGDIATYINGYAFKPEDRGEKGLPIIRIQDLTRRYFDIVVSKFRRLHLEQRQGIVESAYFQSRF